MSTYNDLINVTFEDAVTYTNVDNSDILGVIMPHFWGPAGEISVLNQREFFETYPEFKRSDVTLTNVATKYAQIKSFFNNGGSRVAVYRPAIATEVFAEADTETTTAVKPITSGGDLYLALKYPGLPPFEGALHLVSAQVTGSNYSVSLTDGVASPDTKVYETFIGQITDKAGVDEDGESTYLPIILKNKSAYMQIVDSTEPGQTAPTAVIPSSYTPGAGSDTLDGVFGQQDQLVPTIFLEWNANLNRYCTATFISANTTSGSPLPDTPTITNAEKFHISVWGKEKIKVFGSVVEIDCNAGVAGAYSRVAGETHVNQLASARSYGAYVGTLSTSISFSKVLDWSSKGVVCVYNSSLGPQIFGVRNTYAQTKPGSYFARANVSRTLAAILRNIIPSCLEAIHTDTAANAVTRKVFEANLNSVINGFIATQDLQADSKAICNESNNSDAQTLGGQNLNIILSLHFIGLVERVNIKVIATDSSVTVSVA